MFFESMPMDFEAESDQPNHKLDAAVTWNNLRELIFQNTGGIRAIERAVNNIYDNREHYKQVMEAFTRGQRPPVRLTDSEKKEIINLIDIV